MVVEQLLFHVADETWQRLAFRRNMTTGGEAFAWTAKLTIDFLDNLDRKPR